MRRAVGAAALLYASLAACLAGADVAIVVHPDNPEASLSADELGRVLRQEQRRFKSGGPIYLVFRASGSTGARRSVAARASA